MARATAVLVAFALLFAGVAADNDASTTEHDDHHTTDCDGDHAGHDHCGGGDTTTAQTVSGAWSPRRLSVSALLAFLVVLLTNPVAVSADKDASTTEHDDHHTTDCDGDHAGHDHCGGGDTTTAQTVSGAVQNAGAGALLLSAAAAYVVS